MKIAEIVNKLGMQRVLEDLIEVVKSKPVEQEYEKELIRNLEMTLEKYKKRYEND